MILKIVSSIEFTSLKDTVIIEINGSLIKFN